MKTFELLLADDNPAELRLFLIAMEDAGLLPLVRIQECFDGEQVIETLSQPDHTNFDLIILDLNMPRVGGKDVLSFLRNEYARAFPLVIVLSNSDYKRDRLDCFRLGAQGYITKPSNFPDLKRFCENLKQQIICGSIVVVDLLPPHLTRG